LNITSFTADQQLVIELASIAQAPAFLGCFTGTMSGIEFLESFVPVWHSLESLAAKAGDQLNEVVVGLNRLLDIATNHIKGCMTSVVNGAITESGPVTTTMSALADFIGKFKDSELASRFTGHFTVLKIIVDLIQLPADGVVDATANKDLMMARFKDSVSDCLIR
jgi:hypothetical protein